MEPNSLPIFPGSEPSGTSKLAPAYDNSAKGEDINDYFCNQLGLCFASQLCTFQLLVGPRLKRMEGNTEADRRSTTAEGRRQLTYKEGKLNLPAKILRFFLASFNALPKKLPGKYDQENLIKNIQSHIFTTETSAEMIHFTHHTKEENCITWGEEDFEYKNLHGRTDNYKYCPFKNSGMKENNMILLPPPKFPPLFKSCWKWGVDRPDVIIPDNIHPDMIDNIATILHQMQCFVKIYKPVLYAIDTEILEMKRKLIDEKEREKSGPSDQPDLSDPVVVKDMLMTAYRHIETLDKKYNMLRQDYLKQFKIQASTSKGVLFGIGAGHAAVSNGGKEVQDNGNSGSECLAAGNGEDQAGLPSDSDPGSVNKDGDEPRVDGNQGVTDGFLMENTLRMRACSTETGAMMPEADRQDLAKVPKAALERADEHMKALQEFPEMSLNSSESSTLVSSQHDAKTAENLVAPVIATPSSPAVEIIDISSDDETL